MGKLNLKPNNQQIHRHQKQSKKEAHIGWGICFGFLRNLGYGKPRHPQCAHNQNRRGVGAGAKYSVRTTILKLKLESARGTIGLNFVAKFFIST